MQFQLLCLHQTLLFLIILLSLLTKYFCILNTTSFLIAEYGYFNSVLTVSADPIFQGLSPTKSPPQTLDVNCKSRLQPVTQIN